MVCLWEGVHWYDRCMSYVHMYVMCAKYVFTCLWYSVCMCVCVRTHASVWLMHGVWCGMNMVFS